MSKRNIYVKQIAGGSWKVSRNEEVVCRFFQTREHALAFGLLLASSTRSKLFLHRPDGSYVVQASQQPVVASRGA
jgi:hypothetical protein